MKSDIIGKLWIHVPKVGGWFLLFRNPVVLSLTVSIFSALLIFMVIGNPTLKKKRVMLQ
jgi:hypothetical protein